MNIFLWVDHTAEINVMVFLYVVFCIGIVLSIILNKIPPFSWVYSFLKWFVIFFLAFTVLDMTKKSLKDWWEK